MLATVPAPFLTDSCAGTVREARSQASLSSPPTQHMDRRCLQFQTALAAQGCRLCAEEGEVDKGLPLISMTVCKDLERLLGGGGLLSKKMDSLICCPSEAC